MKGISNMKATGIIRRIDELGRIVIPKEIRRTLRLHEGDPMELYVEKDSVVFKKYSPVGEIKDIADQFVDVLGRRINALVIICDTDNVISASSYKRDYLERPITKELFETLSSNRSIQVCSPDLQIVDNDQNTEDRLIAPIYVDGNVVGGIIVFCKIFSDADKMAVDIISAYITKQLEI